MKNYNNLKTEEFIKRSEIIHNYKYNYSLVYYENSKIKVNIICPIHGIFEQIPNTHLRGGGCEKCSYINRGINKKNKTPYRKWVLNEEFFNEINSEDKAYFLGFLYADGCISDDKSISLGLDKIDIDILEKFNKVLNYNKPIEYVKNTNIVRVRINSHKMFNDLLKNGCHPRKTFTLDFPNKFIIPDNLKHHFIRGYFDGDGCIYINEKKYKNYANFLGCYYFLNELKIIINEIIGEKFYYGKQGKIYNLQIRGVERLILLRNYLYSDATIYLKRKKEKFFSF